MKYFPCFQLGCSVLSGELGGKSEPEFQGFSFTDDAPFFPPTVFCSGVFSYTEEFTCLLQYLWFSFKRSQDTTEYSYLQEVQHHPPLERGMIRGSCIQRELEKFREDYCIIIFEMEFSRVVCPLELEALLEYFSRMLQPRVEICRPAGRACRHRHRNVLWRVLRSICPAGPYRVNSM